jgi:hypothetical protein
MSAADAISKIRDRLVELRCIRDSYLQYQRWRVAEHDHHGAWDVAINLSETECEMSGLQFALDALVEPNGGHQA